jgi:replicative DNA helicase
MITFPTALKRLDQLEAVGGLAYLNSLIDGVPSAANLPTYAQSVRDCFVRRKFIHEASELIGRAYTGLTGTVIELIDSLQESALGLSKLIESKGSVQPIGNFVQPVVDAAEEVHKLGGDGIIGLRTGFPDLDRTLGGMKPGELVILGARTGTGKTALMMNIANNLADSGIGTGIVSTEMPGKSLTSRVIATRAKVNMSARGITNWNDVDFFRITNCLGKVKRLPIWIDERSGFTTSMMRSTMREMVKRYGIKIAMVDHAQRVRHPSARDRRNEVSAVSWACHEMALELGIVVMLASQLGREAAKDEDTEPTLINLRESGDIEEDADKIVLLFTKDRAAESSRLVCAKTAKNREGNLGKDMLTFFAEQTRFESASKVEQADYPSHQKD